MGSYNEKQSKLQTLVQQVQDLEKAIEDAKNREKLYIQREQEAVIKEQRQRDIEKQNWELISQLQMQILKKENGVKRKEKQRRKLFSKYSCL